MKSPKKEPVNDQKFTSHIDFIGTGTGTVGEVFVELEIERVGKKAKRLLIQVDDFPNKSFDFKHLNRNGAALVSSAARTEFANQIQAFVRTPSSISVATQQGLHLGKNGWEFVFGHRIKTQCAGEATLRVCIDSRLAPYTAANRIGGTWEGQTSVLALSVGNSRLMAGLCLAMSSIAKLFGTFEPFGAQLVGTPNSGKTSAAMAIGSTWGCNFRGGRPSSKGYVNSWNITPAKAEDPAAARNGGLLILEETRNAVRTNGSRAQTIFDITMLIAEGSEKDRKTNTDVTWDWEEALLSTSNLTQDQLAAEDGIDIDDAYRGRLIDIGAPYDGDSMFENLHGFKDGAAFADHLRGESLKHFGHLAPRFIKATLVAYADDPDELTAWFNARRQHYLEKTGEITAPHRKLSRINQKFATLYAVGCLGVRLELFPWTLMELREALLSCHRDHVALVARHMVPPSGPKKSALTRLTDYLRNNRALFTDLRTTELKAENHNHDAWRGYVDADKAGDEVFLLSNSVFEKVVGGADAASRLKKLLHGRGLIATAKGAKGSDEVKFVVKRRIGTSKGPDGQREPWRPLCVVISAAILD